MCTAMIVILKSVIGEQYVSSLFFLTARVYFCNLVLCNSSPAHILFYWGEGPSFVHYMWSTSLSCCSVSFNTGHSCSRILSLWENLNSQHSFWNKIPISMQRVGSTQEMTVAGREREKKACCEKEKVLMCVLFLFYKTMLHLLVLKKL